jgi:hypothetical protein
MIIARLCEPGQFPRDVVLDDVLDEYRVPIREPVRFRADDEPPMYQPPRAKVFRPTRVLNPCEPHAPLRVQYEYAGDA